VRVALPYPEGPINAIVSPVARNPTRLVPHIKGTVMKHQWKKVILEFLTLSLGFTLFSCNSTAPAVYLNKEMITPTSATGITFPSPGPSSTSILPSIIPTTSAEKTNSFTIESPLWLPKKLTINANQIRTLLFTQDGYLWAGGPAGVTRWDEKTREYLTYAMVGSREESQVQTLIETADKSLWIGTLGNGITQIDPTGTWKTLTKEDGLPSNSIDEILVSKEGYLWINVPRYARDLKSDSWGIFGRYSGQGWEPVMGGGFYRIAYDSDGFVWLVDYGPTEPTFSVYSRLFRLSERDLTVEEIYLPIQKTIITALSAAPNGGVWIASDKGVFRYDQEQWENMNAPWINGSFPFVTAIRITNDGTAWFSFSYGADMMGNCGANLGGEERGVYRYDGHTWVQFTTVDGLVSDKICDIAIGPDDDIWFGSFDQGISRFDGENWVSYVIK